MLPDGRVVPRRVVLNARRHRGDDQDEAGDERARLLGVLNARGHRGDDQTPPVFSSDSECLRPILQASQAGRHAAPRQAFRRRGFP